MSTMQYQLISDQIRRALIRYYTSATQIIGEYAPQLINSGILHPIFSAKDLHRALNDIGIVCSISTPYAALQDPFNPITDLVENNPWLKQSKLMPKTANATKNLYYIRPYHEIVDMIEENAYFREYEFAYIKHIPPIEFFEDVLSKKQTQQINALYYKIKTPKFNQPTQQWQQFSQHFTQIKNPTRTPIEDAFVTRVYLFKVAFLDAIIQEGQYSLRDMFMMTGIKEKHIYHVIGKSKFMREKRYLIIDAPNIYEARKYIDEPAHVVKFPDGKFLLILKSRVRHKTTEELEQMNNHLKPKTNHTNDMTDNQKIYTTRYPFIVKSRFSMPKFQKTFVTRKLRQLIQTALQEQIPLKLFTTQDLLDFAEQRLDKNSSKKYNQGIK